jgi:hypothetical protein
MKYRLRAFGDTNRPGPPVRADRTFPTTTMKKATILCLLALLGMASCARRNNCPAYGNTQVQAVK